MKRETLKRLIGMLLCLCTFCSYCLIANAEESGGLEDVKRYYPFSSWAVDTGIKHSFIFLENNRRETTRVEIANVVFNILEIKNKGKNITFSDLDTLNSKEQNAVEMVSGVNIIEGYEDGTFRPVGNVTRAEFVTILDRSNLLEEKSDINVKFNDIDNHWAKSSIIKASKTNIISGKGNDCFCPEDTITPQEIFVILDRLVSNNIISKDNFLKAMLDTFECKVYSDKERYIAEEIYGNFDNVQDKITYSWPYENYYNPADWQNLATYEDLQYAIYFSATHNTKIYEEGETRDAYNNVIKATYLMQGIEADNQKYGKNNFLLKNLLRAAKSSLRNITNYNEQVAYSVYFLLPDFHYQNQNEFEEEDVISVKTFLVAPYKDETFIVNGYDYLPLNAPVTKYMLNYYIDRIREYSSWSEYTVTKDEFEFETDISKFPSNYTDYPYIIKGVPKEVYEKPVIAAKYGKKTHKPKQTYLYNFGSDMANIVNRTDNYFNSLVNIDYQNIDISNYKETMMKNSYFADEQTLDNYIQYVKDNEIIIKGTAKTVPGSIVISEPLSYIRVILNFEIVHANTNKDLLFQDSGKNVIYENNKYYFVADIQMTAAWSQNGLKKYAPFSKTLFEDLDIADGVPYGLGYTLK